MIICRVRAKGLMSIINTPEFINQYTYQIKGNKLTRPQVFEVLAILVLAQMLTQKFWHCSQHLDWMLKSEMLIFLQLPKSNSSARQTVLTFTTCIP